MTDHTLLANIFTETLGGRTVLRAMPLLLGVLCVLAIAYRYYSAFLAAKVAALDDSRLTPAHTYNDGQNFHPTNKWVLFGHHFAAISGAGPLIGPVLAIQYGFMPGLLWLVIGVCLAGAVQDMLVLAASVRRGGRSLAEIARTELGKPAAVVVSAAILFIVVIALAGLGFVVVKALGGEEVKLAEGMQIALPDGKRVERDAARSTAEQAVYRFPEGCALHYTPRSEPVTRPETFLVAVPLTASLPAEGLVTLPAGCQQLVPGSSWGTFTIACTIPIALFVGLYMYKIRKGRVVEASLIGAAGVLAATVAGNWVPGSPLEGTFSLTKDQTILALTGYGFIASVLPVWLLLCPRDYLSSFLKIGTIALLVVGTIIANPPMQAPPINEVFAGGGPTFPWGGIFPFVFICIMCGSISGFHALVSSGTTPKMIDKESQVRTIGYGAMLIEGLVGVVALIAAASMDPKMYFDINIDQTQAAAWQPKVDQLTQQLGGADATHLPVEEKRTLADVERMVGGESLRGRTGGAVTLAVGMSDILTNAFSWTGVALEGMMKYWYHFAIMFEALFILTTIDTGTRIARFLLQEAAGAVHPQFGKTDWLPGAVLATAVVTAGWGVLVWSGSIDTIWPMFGIANQLLAVIALCLVTTMLINSGRVRYAPVTLLPMIFVTVTTMTAAGQMIPQFVDKVQTRAWSLPKGALNIGLMVFVIACVLTLLLIAAGRWIAVLRSPSPLAASQV
ncbi:MAG TPA: carbon starvation CstA family protein [Gemmataceae bacterium]|nr:carbon starvation CstA family protein [Gemmataceae bacterium]